MSKRTTLFIIVVFSILLIFAIGKSNYVGTLEKAMNKANIYTNQILYTLETDNGTVVFYSAEDRPNTVGVGLIKKTLLGYDWVFGTGVGSFDIKKPMTYGFSNIGESNEKGNPKALPIFNGVISDDNIDLITLEFKDGSLEEATIIQTDIGKLWYFFPGLDGDYYIPKITGYGSNGEKVFGNK